MKAILLVATICVLGLATQTEESFLSSLKANTFGNTILEVVQLQLEQGGSADKILGLLRAMRADLVAEQREQDSKSKNDQAICEIKISEAQSALTKANEQKVDDERQVPLLEEEQTDKQKQAEDKADQQQRNLDKIHALTEERHEEKSNFEERRDELTALIATLQEARRIISQLKQGSSFLQMTDPIVAEIQKHHNKFLKNHPTGRGLHKMVNVLLSISQDPTIHANQNGVAKIVAVVDELVESIYDVQKQELHTENDKQQAYEINKARLEVEVTRIEGSVADLHANVLKIQQKLIELANDIATSSEVIAVKESELANWSKTCADQDRAHETSTESRQGQLDIIDQAIRIFEIKFDVAKTFLLQMH